MPLTNQDLKNIAQTVERVTAPRFRDLSSRLGQVERHFDTLTTSVDNFSHIVRRHEDEWLVLRAQHEKMRDILVKKGVATEDELAIA